MCFSYGEIGASPRSQQQRKPTHDHAYCKNDVHSSMPFRSRDFSIISPESEQSVAMFLLGESTVEPVCPKQQTRYSKDLAS